MTNETPAERDRTREELDDLQREWLAADDTSMGYRDAREDYLLALADAYEGGELVTRAEVARLVEEAVEREREAALDAFKEAITRYPEASGGLLFFWGASGLGAAKITSYMVAWADAPIRARADRQTEGSE